MLRRFFLLSGLFLLVPLIIFSCSNGFKSGVVDLGSTAGCAAVTGTAWTPSIVGAASGNHDATVVSSVTKNIQTVSNVKIIGFTDTFTTANLTTVTFDLTGVSNFGAYGSMTLAAETTALPSGWVGNAFPVLVSLSDGTNEFVQMPNTAGTYNSFYTCGGSCTQNTARYPPITSGFMGVTDANRGSQYDNHNFNFGAAGLTVNMFPRCNWAVAGCGMKQNNYLVNDGGVFKLRPGVTYTAKYILMADSALSVGGGSYTGTVKLTGITKVDATAGGAVDLNVVLVGGTNVIQSRTAKGKQNLNALFQSVYDHYNQAGMGIKIGSINVTEWGCTEGGDSYAITAFSAFNNLLKTGSALVSVASETKAVNLFLVSSITGSGSLTILGAAGGIVGAPINRTLSSGAVFSTFNTLSTLNASCNGVGVCTIANQDPTSIDMGSTISHEIGHFLGLFHLSESNVTAHDPIPDTPEVTSKVGTSLAISDALAVGSCAAVCPGYNGTTTFCTNQTDCQFNHVMWWTSKNIATTGGNGDGNLFSSQSGVQVNYNIYVQ